MSILSYERRNGTIGFRYVENETVARLTAELMRAQGITVWLTCGNEFRNAVPAPQNRNMISVAGPLDAVWSL